MRPTRPTCYGPILPRLAVALGLCIWCAPPVHAAEAPAKAKAAPLAPEILEFFETKVRPLLAENCFDCHSGRAKSVKGGLKLDSKSAVLHGGDGGEVIVPGKPDESPLIEAIRGRSSAMPPKGKLRDEQIAVLVKWVAIGAPWPGDDDATPAPSQTAAYDWKALRARHWAWQPIAEPALPRTQDRSWQQTPIDAFVLARLEAAGLKPSPPASARVLVRRLYFDLIGLPPTPAEVDAFVRDEAADRPLAVAALVERLLASPHYGERWGRHWLDVARYNDGFGGDFDDKNQPLGGAWRYRDWVVAALNRDTPFNEFLRLQLAGDLVGPEHTVATGFLALGPRYISDGGDPDSEAQARAETLDDRVDTFSRGVLGLTVSCARCHDHKFDPIPQLDYYSLAGVFRNSKHLDRPLPPTETAKLYTELQRQLRDLNERLVNKRNAITAARRRPTPAEMIEIAELEARLTAQRKDTPQAHAVVHVMNDAEAIDMPLAIRGNLRKPGPIAPRRFLRIVAGEDPPRFKRGSGRLELAEAVIAPDNPLTPRVLVNRVWLWHFGQGLVRTPSNFGILGEKPTHPELLDWLASTFQSNTGAGLRWSLKRLHRLIVTSATYQMDSALVERSFAIDGDNRLLWRMNPRRLDVEAWRDAQLAATGELDETLGGIPARYVDATPRRTLYSAVSRKGDAFETDRFLRLFDFPQARATSEGRTSSIVPQQSLFLLNNPFMAARARALAARLSHEAPSDRARIEFAYRLLYGRPVTAEELALGLEFLTAPADPSDPEKLSPWQQYAQALLSANEMMYLE